MRVRYSPRSIGDIDRILRCIAGRSPAGADRVARAIERKIAQLAVNPRSGHLTDFPGLLETFLVRYPCRILYAIREDDLRIASVRHTSRRWPVHIGTD